MKHDNNCILVTGGAGYIGSHTVWALQEAGYKCVVVDNLSTGKANLLPNDIPLIIAELDNKNSIAQIINDYDVTSIIHFAASIVVSESVEDPAQYYQNNLVNFINLAELAYQHKLAAFIFSSTAAVYGDTTVDRVTEHHPTHPLSPYGKAKLMAEQILRDFDQAYGLPNVILRYFNVAGNDSLLRAGKPQANSTHLIQRICQTILGKYPLLEIFGDDYSTPDGSCVRDYIHVSDLASAHVLALEYLLAGGSSELFNCGYGQGYSVFEVVKTAKQISNVDFSVQISQRRPGDAASVIANADKIKQMLNWTPHYNNLDKMLASTLAWEKKRG